MWQILETTSKRNRYHQPDEPDADRESASGGISQT